MTIGKYIKSPLSQVTTVVLAINDAVLNNFTDYTLEKLNGTIQTADATYNPDNITELEIIQKLSVKNIRIAYLALNYKNDDQSFELSLTHSTDDPYIEIKCSGLEVDRLEKIFELLKNEVFKTNYYRHAMISGYRIIQKKAIETITNIFDSLDDLQIRALENIRDEKDFQNFMYPILRSHFDDLEDEHYLPKYGTKTYKPDFGIPAAKLLIELKFIKNLSGLKRCQSEIHDDVIGYLGSSNKYNKIIAAIYNYNNIAINSSEIKKLEMARGIERVIVCKHVTPNNLEDKNDRR